MTDVLNSIDASLTHRIGEWWPYAVWFIVLFIGYAWKVDHVDDRLRKIEREREMEKVVKP